MLSRQRPSCSVIVEYSASAAVAAVAAGAVAAEGVQPVVVTEAKAHPIKTS